MADISVYSENIEVDEESVIAEKSVESENPEMNVESVMAEQSVESENPEVDEGPAMADPLVDSENIAVDEGLVVAETSEDSESSERGNAWKMDTTAPKKYGIKSNPEEDKLEAINQEILQDDDFKEVEDLPEKLQGYKEKFLKFDKDSDGNIDMFGLSRMLEKLGQTKTHLELRKMIGEVDKTKKGTICYRDFVSMMCGPKTSVLKLILLFEEKTKTPDKPTGVAPKRALTSLP